MIVDALHEELATLHAKLAAGEDVSARCDALLKSIAALPVATDEGSRELSLEANRTCMGEAPVSRAVRHLDDAASEMNASKAGNDPDPGHMVPYWAHMQAACEEAPRALRSAAMGGLDADPQTVALRVETMTYCMPTNFKAPPRPGPSPVLVGVGVAVGLALLGGAAVAIRRRVLRRRDDSGNAAG